MKLREPLNARQLQVLRWVADECPPGVMTGDGHKTSARALHHRKLLKISRTDGMWNAVVTEDGNYYLEHGHHRPVTSPAAKPARQAKVMSVQPPEPKPVARPRKRTDRVGAPVHGKTEELIERVLAAGGQLHIDHDDGRNIPALVGYANRRDKVPPGMRMVQRWARGGYHVRLEPLPDWMTTELIPIPVPDVIRRPHPVIATLKAKDSALFIKGPPRARALRLLHALVQEAAARGYTVKDNMPKNRHGFHERGSKNGQLTITAHSHAVGVYIGQQEDRTPHVPTASELRQQETQSWFRMPKWDKSPSDRLTISLDAPHQTRQGSWSDGVTSSLNDKLAEVLQEIELRCAAAVAEAEERVRQQQRRREAWEHAMSQAKLDYILDAQVSELHQQVADWKESAALTAFAEVVAKRTAELTGDDRQQADEWLSFITERARALDPLHEPLRMPVVEAPTATDLQPFLQGWNAYGP